jgi:hypothetical protein
VSSLSRFSTSATPGLAATKPLIQEKEPSDKIKQLALKVLELDVVEMNQLLFDLQVCDFLFIQSLLC